jgi:ABC-2 type transport system ATP-binding protein
VGDADLLLEVQNLSKSYSHVVLSDLNFQLKAGESVALVGANGAGKSTLIKILLGLVHPTSGSGRVMGFELGDSRGREALGYLPELPGFWPEFSAVELLDFTLKMRGFRPPGLAEKISATLKALGLSLRGERPMGQYSKGMLQRTGVAQALIHNPRLLILDEPMSGLDPRAQAKLRMILKKLRERKVSLLISSHSLEDIRSLCDRVLVLEKSRLVENGPTEEVLDRLNERYQSSEPWDEDPIEGDLS